MNMNELQDRFEYHTLNNEQKTVVALIREQMKVTARFIDDAITDGREKSLALTKLEECAMWINKAISRSDEYEED